MRTSFDVKWQVFAAVLLVAAAENCQTFCAVA
jgi:hypothetical protein